MKPLVSVIITTRNEEKHIKNCLESIKKQSYKNLEVIVVDNNSTDNTKKIARKYTKKVYNKGPERSAQRNYGVKKSSGSWFLYLDADMILSPRVIEDCVNHIKKGIVGMYIPEIIMGNSFWSKVRRFERSFYNGTIIDCARFINKKAFKEAGGFDLNLTGPEDWDLDKKLRLKGKTTLISEPLYHNEAKFNMKKYLAKKSYYSKSMSEYINKWGKNDPDIKKQLNPYYRLIGVFTEKGKWKKLLKHPILTIGMYYLRLRVAMNYLRRLK